MTNTLPMLPVAPAAAGDVQPPATGALRLGGLSPLFPPAAVADAGRLRLGGLSPLFAPPAAADAGLIRMGGLSPLFARG